MRIIAENVAAVSVRHPVSLAYGGPLPTGYAPRVSDNPVSTDGPAAAAVSGLAAWHRLISNRDPSMLADLLADDVVFHSPVVHSPQVGRARTTMYLAGAMHVLGNSSFRYVRQVCQGHNAVLEFRADIDGVEVNGVDMISFDADGRWLLPGLWDAHVHPVMWGLARARFAPAGAR